MKSPSTRPSGGPERLLPLLRVIALEIEERVRRLVELDRQARQFRARTPRKRLLDAQAATHKRELRNIRRELRGLGCSIQVLHPIILRVPSPGDESVLMNFETTPSSPPAV